MLSQIRTLITILKHTFTRADTVEYPEQKPYLSPRYRGRIVLTRDPDGEERCVACNLCSVACPVDCISVVKTEKPDGRWEAESFTVNFSRCIMCGFCEEACPVDAIVMTDIHEYHMEDPATERVINKQQLLVIGDENEASIAANRKQDIPYHR